MSLKLLNIGCGGRFHPAWTNLDLNPAAPTVQKHDLRNPLPFPNNHFHAVYHSHVLEHLTRDEAPGFLAECRRVLRPTGVIRVVVPDLETIARLYLQSLEGALTDNAPQKERYQWIVLELLDQMVRTESGGEMLKYWQQEHVPAEDFVIERVGHEYLNFRKTHPVRRSQARKEQSAPERLARQLQFQHSGELHRWMYDRFSLRYELENAGFIEITTCTASESRIPDFRSYLLDEMEDGTVRKPDSLFMEAVKRT